MSEYIDKLFLSGQEIPIQDSGAREQLEIQGTKLNNVLSALNDTTGAKLFTFVQKSYIKTGVSLGSAVDLSPKSNAAFEYAILDCQENDKVTITAYGQATNARLWAFLDANNKLLKAATGSQQETDLTIIAPPKTAKCVLNSYIGYTGVCYINGITKTVGDTIAEAVSAGNAEVEQNVKEWTSPLLRGLKKFDLPAEFQYVPRIDVYSDGNQFATNFAPENFKNSSGAVIYVDNSGNSGTAYDGSTPEKATSFSNALYIAADGDTIMILEDLSRDGGSANSAINKSVNIIGKSNDTTIFDGNFVQFSKVSGYDHVYSANRPLATGAIDVTNKNKLLKFVEAQSIAEVESAVGSVFISGNTVYVHPYSAASITNRKILVTVDYEKWLDVSNADAAADKNVYFENITLIGRYGGVHIDKPVAGYDLRVCFNHCAFRFCGHDAEGYNAVDVSGGDVLFYRCKVLDGGRDGINYHGAAASGTEIDCIAAGNGKGARNNTMNGSTCHLGARCLRINGKYYDNQGANVADVQEDTQSVNLGCIAFQPACDDGYSQNFSAQQSGATVWLYNCIGVGAEYDLYAAAGTTLYADKCAYDVKEARGTITDTNNRKVNSALLFGMVMNGD